MITALLISSILLWFAVLGLSLLVLALLRQIGVLHERIAPAGALTTGRGPEIGQPAPLVEAIDWNGATRAVGAADPQGTATLLLFVSPTCPVCKTLLPIAQATIEAEATPTRLVLASDGPRAEHEAFVREHRLERYGYLLSGPLGMAYGAGKLPYAVLIDAAGIVRARGLVNTREHLESLFEAMQRGVASIQEHLRREQSRPLPLEESA